MPSVFKKLNLKDHDEIVVLNSPPSFESELAGLSGVKVVRNIAKVRNILFSLAFVTKQKELNVVAKKIAAKARGDAIVWMCYPKKTSKKYTCEFDRDSGWSVLGTAGFEGVRMVAVDEDWSALRFRRVEFIKSLKRDSKRAMTSKGKKRTSSR